MTIKNQLRSIVCLLAIGAITEAQAQGQHNTQNDHGKPAAVSASSSNQAGASEGRYQWWRNERARRQRELDAFLSQNAEDLDWFRASVGFTGVPMILFRVFPELFPEYWGTVESNYESLGFFEDPYDPSRVLPMGLNYAPGNPPIKPPPDPFYVQVAQLSCAACHTGRVQHPDGQIDTLMGAPSSEFEFHGWENAVLLTVNDPNFTAANFVAAIKAKTPGWLYNDPAMLEQEKNETELFMNSPEYSLDVLRNLVNSAAKHDESTLLATTYSHPNSPNLAAPHPGTMETSGGFASMSILDPSKLTIEEIAAIMPPAPAMSDHMPAWQQGGRAGLKWSNDIPDHTHGNAGAAMGIVGPTNVDMAMVNGVSRFVTDLPSAPYPFDIDTAAAKRGQRLYKAHCADCHAYGNDNVIAPEETGTDPNRAYWLSDFAQVTLTEFLRIACDDPVTCRDAAGNPLPDDRVLQNVGGYAAVPLDGIWARGPYLHNGSVPTLEALLTGDRPETFYRGNITFDEQRVGFTYEQATSPHASLYDTSLLGNSNGGHDAPPYDGYVDWANEPRKLRDLIEYLKTL